MHRRCAALAVAAILVSAGTAYAQTSQPPRPSSGPTFPHGASSIFATWQDDRIDESSALLWVDGTLITTNDSGDTSVLYASAGRTGTVTGTLTYHDDDPRDVEALAWGPGRTLWVGDIGDNARKREHLTLTKLVNPPLKGNNTVKGKRGTFTYPPKERHDAEALVVHPTTGKAYIVTKEFFGAGFYEVPDSWSTREPAQLTRVADAPAIVTDGTFSPDGTHIYLRTYSQVLVYSYPALAPVSVITMPRQDQGEAITNGPGGTLLLSSEGINTPILQVAIPAEALTPPQRAADVVQPATNVASGPGTWVIPAFMVLGGAFLGVALMLIVRPRRSR